MARILCKCGTQLRDDDPDFTHLLFRGRDFDVEEESAVLLGRAKEVWECPVCGRLWIFWDVVGDRPTEYVRQPDDAVAPEGPQAEQQEEFRT